MTTVAGQGDAFLNDYITLKNVHHVPQLCTNLVPIQKLTRYSNCVVMFYPSHCVFQEQGTKRMIGHAREMDGLYHLEESNGRNRVKSLSPLSFLSESFKSNKDKIWLQRLRLSHPSFNVLKIMFPALFKGLAIENFCCDVRELAKHKCASFQIRNKRTSAPFTLIHGDI